MVRRIVIFVFSILVPVALLVVTVGKISEFAYPDGFTPKWIHL